MSKNIATFSEYIGCIVESKGKREAIGHISLTANGKLSYIGVYEKFSDSFQIEFDIGWLKEPFLTGPSFGNRLFVGIHSANDSVGFLMSRDTLGKFADWLDEEVNKL